MHENIPLKDKESALNLNKFENRSPSFFETIIILVQSRSVIDRGFLLIPCSNLTD
jgi:hypothetical protein